MEQFLKDFFFQSTAHPTDDAMRRNKASYYGMIELIDRHYGRIIDALDEMQICNIGKYVITDIAEADEFLIKNYDAKGELSQNLADN